jgi:hypothetical protein
VTPQAGSVVAFEHGLLHEGEPVTSGRKYAIRTDAMYRQVGPPAGAPPAVLVRCAPDGFDARHLPADSYKGAGACAGGVDHDAAMDRWRRASAQADAVGTSDGTLSGGDRGRGGGGSGSGSGGEAPPTLDPAREFAVGDRVYALNPKWLDSTRLRTSPSRAAAFNGTDVLNDTARSSFET